MNALQVLLIIVTLFVLAVYAWLRHSRNYWSRQGAPYDKTLKFFKRRTKHLAFMLHDFYKRHKPSGHPFIGTYVLNAPTAILLDLDLIKRVFIADFESFPDRGFYHNVQDDPLTGHIVRLDGEAWRRLRTKLTPTFSSGKMKVMFPAVVQVAERLSEVMGEEMAGNGLAEIRDLCARYTTDVIGTVAFGIECNSLRNPETPFRVMGDKVFNSYKAFVEHFGALFPRLFRLLHVRTFPSDLTDFYCKIIRDNVKYREQHQVRRNDFLDLLIELQQAPVYGGDTGLTMNEIIAQSFAFFVAGYDTSSSNMSFCLYALSHNLEVQEKARAEIKECLRRHNGQLSYECLKEMHYLEQVVLEALRMYPVAPGLRRVTRKPFRVPNTPYTFDPEVQIIIPVYAIHHDPTYYPEPDKFDPERFTPAAIKERHPMTFMAFGAGPRACIAERFGKLQTLVGLAVLLSNYKFSATEQTPKELKYDLKNFRILCVVGGIQLKVERVD